MDVFVDGFSWAMIIGGLIFCLIGGYGLMTLKDMYARLHAASLIDTLGVGLVFVGLMMQAGFTLATAKLLIILLFIFFTSPTSTHALTRAAINGGTYPTVDDPAGRALAESTKNTVVQKS
ncbi:monovalent cation/H(+) antiporter subunit G [Rhodospirillales bacterium]|nr:monovalent cation/H(+) antiporter subunit G [Rhodospirillales bacterium]